MVSLDEVNNYLLRVNIIDSAILGTKDILMKRKNKVFIHMALTYVYMYTYTNDQMLTKVYFMKEK